jgi:hypothetical protein
VNFDDALKAHVSWKMKLQGYLLKPDNSIDVAALSADNQCELGKWIYGDGSKYEGEVEFRRLKAAHEKFHKAAGNVVQRANSGQNVRSEVELGSASQFSLSSQAVVSAIMALKPKVKKV